MKTSPSGPKILAREKGCFRRRIGKQVESNIKLFSTSRHTYKAQRKYKYTKWDCKITRTCSLERLIRRILAKALAKTIVTENTPQITYQGGLWMLQRRNGLTNSLHCCPFSLKEEMKNRRSRWGRRKSTSIFSHVGVSLRINYGTMQSSGG